MNVHDKENSLRCDMPLSTSRNDPILLEPSTTKPPVQAPKPVSSLVPDFEAVNISVISDASEFDSVIFPNNNQNRVIGSYPPFSNYDKIDSVSPLFYLNAKPTPNIHPEVHKLVSGTFRQSVGGGFKSNANGVSPQARMQNIASPKAYQHSIDSPNYMLNRNGGHGPYDTNSPFFSNHQNIANNNKVNAYDGFVHLINQSDSVTLLPQQLQFHETNTINKCVNSDDISHSKHVSKCDSNASHSMNVHQKVKEHHSLEERKCESDGSTNKQGSGWMNSNEHGFSKTGELYTNVNARENVSSEMWSLFHEQNEKIKQLQNQLSAIQQQNSTVVVSKQETATLSSEDKKFEMINESLKSILHYITEHNNTILTLKDQVSILTKRTDELESRGKTNESEPLDFSKAGISSNLKVPNKSDSSGDIMCRNETHVKKISSSTMTSVTMDGSEKLLFSKTTVVTENCQKDMLLPQTPAQLNRAGNCSGKGASGCVTQGPSDSKKLRRSKRAGRNERGLENVSPNVDLVAPSAVKLRAGNHKNPSPLSDSNQVNKNMKARQSPREKNLPTFNSILQNIDNLVLQNDEDEDSSEKHRCCCRCKENKSSPTGASLAERKSRVPKNTEACAYSNTSEDSDYASPNSGWTEESAKDEWYDSTKKKYGIPPSLMSVDTQQYLEKHRLCDSERRSSKKSNSSHLRQHLR